MKNLYKVLAINYFAFFFFVSSINANNLNTTPPSHNDNNLQQFVVYYNGDMTKLMQDKDSYLNAFLESYDLEIISIFEISENNRGFSLVSKEKINIPNQLARELSELSNVVMVEIIDNYTKNSEI